MLLALLVGVPCQRLAPTAGKSEPLRQQLLEVRSGMGGGGRGGGGGSATTCSRAQLPPSPAPSTPRSTSAQSQNPAKDQTPPHNTITTTHTESHIYSFCNTFAHSHQPPQLDQEVSQEKHLDGAILICTVSPVGKLLTRVFPPCPNSIANLFSPSACFHLIQKNKFVSVWPL